MKTVFDEWWKSTGGIYPGGKAIARAAWEAALAQQAQPLAVRCRCVGEHERDCPFLDSVIPAQQAQPEMPVPPKADKPWMQSA